MASNGDASRLVREVEGLTRNFVVILLVGGAIYGFVWSKDISSDAFLTIVGGALGWLYAKQQGAKEPAETTTTATTTTDNAATTVTTQRTTP